jgi:glycosyltransferase involved in cell wall biosynthesis
MPVVLVVPIAPARTGNGLAMRAGMLLDALADATDVHVVVVPVSGPATLDAAIATTPASVTVGSPADPPDATCLPEDARRSSAVLCMRTYLAPFGIPLGRAIGARVVVDADDDDAPLLASLGDDAGAARADELARTWLPRADAVVAASPLDAAGIAARAGLEEVAVVPNAVPIPDAVPPPPGADRLLFVGNLTYEPNIAAARLLAEQILPDVRSRHEDATLQLVGSPAASVAALARHPGVDVAGAVPDVSTHYATADVVVVPLRHGAGTRIKVLEAFGHRRPVVATPTAVAGLAVEPEGHALVADDVTDLAALVDRVLAAPDEAAPMIDRAHRLVRECYSPAAVAPLVRAAVLESRA